MKFCILMGSPRRSGNTAALVGEFADECARMGAEAQVIPLYDRAVNPCLGCKACQDCFDGPGCVQDDDFEDVFAAVSDSDVVIFATPIYAWYCTAPMKALLDRMVYAGSKRYGESRGPDLLAGVRAASIVTCGYPAEKGADLWEEGLKRTCRHTGMKYMGAFCRRDRGGDAPFLDEEKARAVRDFARDLVRAVRADGL